MKKLILVSMIAALAGAPLAAQAADPHQGGHAQKYPKGWGPHHGPDGKGYYHGYQGSHDHRPGYRKGHDGLWYPAAAFTIGAIVGGALSH